jgi:hypothetical protein
MLLPASIGLIIVFVNNDVKETAGMRFAREKGQVYNFVIELESVIT